MHSRTYALAIALALSLAACDNGGPDGPATPSTYGNPELRLPPPVVIDYSLFQPTLISPPAGSQLTISSYSTYEEYLANRVHLAGTFHLRDEDLPACVALLYVRGYGRDSIVVGGGYSEFRDKPAKEDSFKVTHLLTESEQFWGYARGYEVNALFIVGKPSPDNYCGNRMLVRCSGDDPFQTCMRHENIARTQIIPVRYTLKN